MSAKYLQSRKEQKHLSKTIFCSPGKSNCRTICQIIFSNYFSNYVLPICQISELEKFPNPAYNCSWGKIPV